MVRQRQGSFAKQEPSARCPESGNRIVCCYDLAVSESPASAHQELVAASVVVGASSQGCGELAKAPNSSGDRS